MLGQALVLALLLFLQGHQGRDSPEHVVGLSGKKLSLQPPTTQTNHINSVQWKIHRPPTSETSVILTWKNGSRRSENWTNGTFKERFDFEDKNLALGIEAARREDSGLYTLEVTDDSGRVKNHQFQVSVFDHVTLEVAEERKVLDGGKCQVFLSCSVSGGADVSYSWLRGSKQIQTPNNLSKLEQQIDVKDLETYTCNVSNPVSWESHTFSPSCPSVDKEYPFVHYLVLIVISLIILFLVALACFCVWRRKRKQCNTGPGEPLTVYEDVNNLQNRCNQTQRQNPPEGSTVYSTIQAQSSAPTARETNTLYALVQPSRKSESKKKNQSSPFSYTIYEEVGKTQLKAQNPARLSRRELENFCVYS